MKRSFWPYFLVLSLCSLAQAEPLSSPINFKFSKMVDSSNEGPDKERTFFTMGARKIAFEQPQKTEITAEPDNLTVYLANRGIKGQFSVSNSTLPAALDFVTDVQRYFEAAEATLPGDAKDVEIKGSDFRVYAVSGRTCLAMDWTYSLFGHAIHRRIAYVKVDAEHQVCLTVIADEESWQPASALARSFMNSWFWADDVKGRVGVASMR